MSAAHLREEGSRVVSKEGRRGRKREERRRETEQGRVAAACAVGRMAAVSVVSAAVGLGNAVAVEIVTVEMAAEMAAARVASAREAAARETARGERA